MLETYKSYFGDSKQPEHIFSPYRIAPLGAHVDHQRGIISGFAIDKGMELFFTKNESGIVDIRSMNFRGEVTFDLQLPVDVKHNDWGDYARGAVYALKKRFNLKYGINGLIKGTLPIGGLSS
ncbi:MAG: galactokinase, partial [Dysgonamonadaceae bacterium]|nr:galactokinase [Dysgonamonadaceae bacterium]